MKRVAFSQLFTHGRVVALASFAAYPYPYITKHACPLFTQSKCLVCAGCAGGRRPLKVFVVRKQEAYFAASLRRNQIGNRNLKSLTAPEHTYSEMAHGSSRSLQVWKDVQEQQWIPGGPRDYSAVTLRFAHGPIGLLSNIFDALQ